MDLICRAGPVAWALFVQGLGESAEHLSDLAKRVANDPDYGEEELRVDLGHVCGHLNRAWNSRHIPKEVTDAEWEELRRFPTDLEPIA